MVLASSCTVSAQPLQTVCEEGDVLAPPSSPSPLEEAIASLVLPLRKGTEREMLPVSSFAGAIWFSLPMEICASISLVRLVLALPTSLLRHGSCQNSHQAETLISSALPRLRSTSCRLAVPALVSKWNWMNACIGRKSAPDKGFCWFPLMGEIKSKGAELGRIVGFCYSLFAPAKENNSRRKRATVTPPRAPPPRAGESAVFLNRDPRLAKRGPPPLRMRNEGPQRRGNGDAPKPKSVFLIGSLLASLPQCALTPALHHCFPATARCVPTPPAGVPGS